MCAISWRARVRAGLLQLLWGLAWRAARALPAGRRRVCARPRPPPHDERTPGHPTPQRRARRLGDRARGGSRESVDCVVWTVVARAAARRTRVASAARAGCGGVPASGSDHTDFFPSNIFRSRSLPSPPAIE